MASAAERRGVLGGFCYGHSSRAAGGVRGVLLWPQQQSGGRCQGGSVMASAAERRGVLGGLCYGLSSRAAGGVRGVLLWPQQQSGGGC